MDGPKRLVYDLPGGEPRLLRDCQGLCYSLVNGQLLVEKGKVKVEAGAGQVLRSGQ